MEFQLNAICAEISDNGIEKALKRVPKDLDATYERILTIINEKPQAQCELARRTLIWITYARQPLPIHDLAHAISIEIGTKGQEELESSIPTEESIIDACSNLISVDRSKNRYVRFVHFSVQEFFTSHRSATLPTLSMGYELGHREIAQVCMTFLTLFRDRSDFLARLYMLHQYVLKEWPHHLLVGNLNKLLMDDPIVTLTLSFFQKSPVLLTEQPERLWKWWEKKKAYLQFSPSMLSLIFNLPGTETCSTLCKKQVDSEEMQSKAVNDNDVNCKVVANDKLAIHYATAELDSAPVARRLYSHGYALNYSYPNIEVQDWLQLSPLYSVQSAQVARYLLDNGISIEPQRLRGTFVDPLEYLAKVGNRVEVLQLLLDRVVDQSGGRLKDVLQTAAYHGKIEIARLLLDKGASVHDQGGRYGNALQAATYGGRIDVIRLLLDKGADVNVQGGTYGNALQAAACCGEVEVVQLLLDKGASVNAQGGKYGNALLAATYSYNCSIEIIRLLLDRGADVNALGGMYGNALQVAVYKGNVEVIQLLLDRGADVNAQGGWCGNPLQAAAHDDKIAIIRLLLDKGADVNAQGGKYGNALQTAAYSYKQRSVEVIRLLLDEGADVNAQGGEHGSALQAAACSGNKEVIQLLLDMGADVNAQGGRYGNALQAAAHNGNTEVVQLLLDNGADINAGSGEYSAALKKMLALGPENDGKNTDGSEDKNGGTGNEAPQELQQSLSEPPAKKNTPEAAVHMWKLFGFTFLVFLLYTFIGFSWV